MKRSHPLPSGFHQAYRRLGMVGALAAALASSALPAPGQQTSAPATSTPTSQQAAVQTYIRSLALQTATYAVPLVAMYNLRQSIAFKKGKPNQLVRVENIATPEIAQQLGYVTPNVNVVYGFGFFDLSQGPTILKVPNSRGRYYVVQLVDMWTNDFAYVGGKTTGYAGGTFALVGPGWHGAYPAGVKRINCPTRWVELQPRVHVKNPADLAAAQAVLRGITVQSLAEYEGRPAPASLSYHYPVANLNKNVASSYMQFDDPAQFWTIFSNAMNENPPPAAEIKAVLPQFAYLGIKLGRQWTPQSVNATTLEQMNYVSSIVGRAMLANIALAGNAANGWAIPPANTGLAGNDYVLRAFIAVFGLTANTPHEAIYYAGTTDSTGQPLTGAKKYTITFSPPMTYLTPIPPGFWSVTMYDAVTAYTVPNPINRYALGSDDAMKKSPDGSFTLYVQHDNPGADKERNWLPSPAGPFYLTLRNYAPVDEVVKQLNKDPAAFKGPPPIVATP